MAEIPVLKIEGSMTRRHTATSRLVILRHEIFTCHNEGAIVGAVLTESGTEPLCIRDQSQPVWGSGYEQRQRRAGEKTELPRSGLTLLHFVRVPAQPSFYFPASMTYDLPFHLDCLFFFPSRLSSKATSSGKPSMVHLQGHNTLSLPLVVYFL